MGIYKYRPAAEETAETVEWLCSEEGHAWQNDEILRLMKNGTMQASAHGLTSSAWISMKGDLVESYLAVWMPPRHRDPDQEWCSTWWHVGIDARPGWREPGSLRPNLPLIRTLRVDRCWCSGQHEAEVA